MATLRSRRTTERGYTLLELLVVLMLISVLSGIGLGFLMQQGSNIDRSVAQFRDLARAARAQARLTRAPARLEIVPPPSKDVEEERRLLVYAQSPIGEWNFDRGRAKGTGGLGGEAVAGRIAPGGRFGNGLWTDGGGDAHGFRFDVRTLSSFAIEDGFVARCDVNIRDSGACIVLRMGESFELGIDAQQRLRGSVTLMRDDGSSGRRVRLKGLRRLEERRWYRVELEAAAGEVAMMIDGVREAGEAIDARIWRDPQAWLVFSDAASALDGAIDTVQLYAMTMQAEQSLDPMLIVRGPAQLAFDASGEISRRVHPELPLYTFELDEAETGLLFERQGLTR